MILFVAFLSLAGFLSMAVLQLIRLIRNRMGSDEKGRLLPYLLILDFVLMLIEILMGTGLESRLPFDLFLAEVPMLVLISAVVKEKSAIAYAKVWGTIVALYAVYCLLSGLDYVRPMHSETVRILLGTGAIYLCAQYVMCLFVRVREIRLVMKSGNVWSFLLLATEGVYLSFTFLCTTLLLMSQDRIRWLPSVVSVLILSQMVALFIRLSYDSLFVFWMEHERRIVESMKIASVEVTPVCPKVESVYKDIYERVVSLFENDRLYLDSDLTINELVKVVFTNKLYISRAISRFTGRNFCQFVNLYRVNHSVSIFRKNPEMKVSELAAQSGFNTVASYSAAFKLYMGESPSDWCRKERNLLLKKKK